MLLEFTDPGPAKPLREVTLTKGGETAKTMGGRDHKILVDFYGGNHKNLGTINVGGDYKINFKDN